MLRFELSPDDLAGIRFAHSPMAEVTASLVALADTGRFWMYASWRARVAPGVAALGLRTLPLMVARPHGRIPDFLTPVPPMPRPRLRDELAVVAATPPELIAYDLELTWRDTERPPEIAAFTTDPRGALATLVREIRRYFEVALAPFWPRMRAAAEAEIAWRSRDAADRGPRALLEGLHPTVSWNTEALLLGGHRVSENFDHHGRGLTLLPAAFTGPKVFGMTGSPNGQALWYPPRGYGALWTGEPPEPAAALSALLGPTRAAVLTALDLPRSTGEIAEALGIAPATASHHLTTLRDAGLIVGDRVGRRLRYLRTGLGDELGGRP